jgi:hypothetical protein
VTIDEMIEVLQAARSGETIQYREVPYGDWVDNPYAWNFTTWEYRVKPKPRAIYRIEQCDTGICVWQCTTRGEAEQCLTEVIDHSSYRIVEYVEKLT